MTAGFGPDPFPGHPRILFVGFPDSSHTHGWINLVHGCLNVRLFGMPRGLPPDSWPVKTYITQSTPKKFTPDLRKKLYFFNKIGLNVQNAAAKTLHGVDAPRHYLAKVIRDWKPQVVHTLGLDESGYFYMDARDRFGLTGTHAWVLQLWGGSDLFLAQHDPHKRSRLVRAIIEANVVLTDTPMNINIAQSLGVPPIKAKSFKVLPGAGGVDSAALRLSWRKTPAARKDIFWPKAYECRWSKALPVFEAIRMLGSRLEGRFIHMLAANEEAIAWHNTLPEYVRRHCPLSSRIPHSQAIEILGSSRIMLAPSLVDGMPNALYEAMALGALPIVSPLETITPMVQEPQNVLFARNLYPDEIATALIRAIEDDALVNTAAEQNQKLVARLANRRQIAPKVIRMYEELAAKCVL